MKIINRKNILPTTCIIFTILVSGKLIYEKYLGITDNYYTENIFACLFFSFLGTGILGIHYYLRNLPIIPIIIVQYLIFIGAGALLITLGGSGQDIPLQSYYEMFRSQTIPYVIGAACYYLAYFREIHKMNNVIKEIKGRTSPTK